jgi:DNA-directed RNA polymerase subunit K/omega
MRNMPNTKYRSRYEKTRIISARALQISQCSPILVEAPRGVIKPVEIAKLEFEKGLVPITVKRPMPVVKKRVKAAV